MKNLLFVAIEPPWPATQGGRVRMAGLISGLSASLDVSVVTWGSADPNTPVPVKTLPVSPTSSRLDGFASLDPRIVRQVAGRNAREKLLNFVAENSFDAVMYSHSYLAAALPVDGVQTIVDFANIEAHRYRSFAKHSRGLNRLSAIVECGKAQIWEPRVARSADLVTVLSDVDSEWAKAAGASPVLVPNGISPPVAATQSPSDGPALYLASMDYEFNYAAGAWLVDHVWPRVRRSAPNAELVIAGRGSMERFGNINRPGVKVLGSVEELKCLYANAALVLAPVASGGGRQLKVVEALGYGRTMVCTRYSMESVPVQLQHAVMLAEGSDDFADAVSKLLANPQERWRLEAEVRECRCLLPTWTNVADPISRWVTEHA